MSDPLRQTKEMIEQMVADARRKRNEDDRRFLMANIGTEIGRAIAPLIERIADSARLNKEDFRQLISYLKGEFSKIEVQAPEVHVPEVYVPEPKVTVNVPPMRVPDVIMPEEMQIRGWVQLQGVDLNNPLPVQLRDKDGKPVDLFGNLTTLIGGGGGGAAHIVRVSGFAQSAFSEVTNPDGRVKVELPSGGGGLTDTELRAAHLDVQQVSGAVDSVNVLQLAGDALAKGTELNAGVLRVVHVTDVGMSVSATDLDIRDLANATDSVSAYQVSGANWSVNVTNTVPVSATDLDIRDLANATDSVSAYQISGASWSVSAAQSGSWSVSLSGALTSAVVTGPTAVDANDDGTAPVQGGGIARTTNPTAVADGDVVKSTHDDLGRQLMRPIQVRDLLTTAYATLSNGSETTLLAASAGVMHDLIYIMGANTSGAAVQVDIRAVTGGNVILTLMLPASGTAGVALPVPIPQSDTGNNWTADMGDYTNTTVYLSALFSKEV